MIRVHKWNYATTFERAVGILTLLMIKAACLAESPKRKIKLGAQRHLFSLTRKWEVTLLDASYFFQNKILDSCSFLTTRNAPSIFGACPDALTV